MFSHLAVRTAIITALTIALSGAVAGTALAAPSRALAGGALAAPAGPKGGKPPVVQQCYNGGWERFVRSNGTTFVDQAACVAYVESGGVLTFPAAVTPTLNFELGTCTVDPADPAWLLCPAISLTGSGLKPGASVTQCVVNINVCETYANVVESDGTLPDAMASFADDCMAGDVFSWTTTTARGATISVSDTCEL